MDVTGLLILLGVGLLIGWVMLVAHSVVTLTCPPRRTYGWAVARSLPGDPSELRLAEPHASHELKWSKWTFRVGDIGLPVWDIAGLDPAGPTIILTHGWSDSRVVMLSSGRVAATLPLASRLILWDLPGHGEAPGRCTLGLDEPVALRALIGLVAEPSRAVVLWGFSLGATISIKAAGGSTSVAAVITEAPYLLPRTPAVNVLRMRGLPYRSNLPVALALIGLMRGAGLGFSGRSRAVTLDAAAVACPLLVMHGTADVVSPVDDGRRLATSAPNGEFVEIADGQHQSLFFAPQTANPATTILRRFLGNAQARSRSGN